MAGAAPRFLSNHWKIVLAAGAGLTAYLVLPPHWSALTRILTAWNVTVFLLLGIIFAVMTRLSAVKLEEHYQEDDPTAPVILLVVIIASILSVAGIVAFLSTLKQAAPSLRTAHIILAALTIVGSWTLLPTIYALHYMDLFYSEPAGRRPLSFPGTRTPVFWDFAYFSFTIAAACQTADVSTRGVPIRKMVIAHSVISVLFNVSILGFAVNVTAQLLS
jgi:uncharacterized membrane protein